MTEEERKKKKKKQESEFEKMIMSIMEKSLKEALNQAKGDKEGAVKAYKDLTDSSSNDSFANLAKSRLIALESEAN